MSDNQKFLYHASKLISEEPNHPLRFLLNSEGNIATMANRLFNIYSVDDWRTGKPHLTVERPTNDRTTSEDIALADSKVVVSCDACHVHSKSLESLEHFALGISGEDNRSHGPDERKLKQNGFVLVHDAVLIGEVPVIKDSALKWEKAGFLPEGTVSLSPPSAGWTYMSSRIPLQMPKGPSLDQLRSEIAERTQSQKQVEVEQAQKQQNEISQKQSM